MPELDTFTIDIIRTGVYEKNPVPVFPKGTFKIQTVRTDFYFRNILDGVMTFQGADFNLIYNEDPCVEFLIKCDFTRNGSGLIWEGVFTKTDCRINTSKKYIEVTPAPYDDYRHFLPYLQVPVNVLPPVAYGGETFGPDTYVRQTRSYRKETRVVEIKEPYTGPNSENWVGYSVNDWVGGVETNYIEGDQSRNSLIWRLTQGIGISSVPASDAALGGRVNGNLLSWIDYGGYERMIAEDSYAEFYNAIKDDKELFTLCEVINHYNTSGEWERCELIYEREVWEGTEQPPSGSFMPSGPLGSYDPLFPLRYNWLYLSEEEKWIRRPLDMFGIPPIFPSVPIDTINQDVIDYSRHVGDGTWYSDLSDTKEIADGYIRKQVLYRNRYLEDLHGAAWYAKLYGTANVRDRYHRLPTLISKFLVAVKNKGGDYFPLKSDFLESEISPIKNIPNDWYNTLIIQNSDFKRPESSEKATKQEFTFREFLDSFCSLTNTGWALIDGKFRLEHTSFFDNGLTYTPDFNDPAQFINPLSLENAAKSKGYLNMSNDYRYEQKEMQRFEIFSTDGGEEPDFQRAEIEYDTPCANNYPDENTLEYDINNLTLDPEWVLREAGDAGMLLIKGNGSPTPDVVTQRVYRIQFSDYALFPADGYINFDFYASDISEGKNILFRRDDFGLGSFMSDLAAFVAVNPYVEFSNGQRVTLSIVAPDVLQFSGNTSLIFFPYLLVGMAASDSITVEYFSGVWIEATVVLAYLFSGFQPYINGGTTQGEAFIFDITHSVDEYGRYRLNNNFSLDYILKVYHTYRRSFKKGDINKTLYQFISRPYMIHNLWFPYRLELEPYKRVFTELGYGIIRSADFNCKDGVTEMVVGYQERGHYSFEEAPEEEIIPLDDYYDDTPTFDDPGIELPSFTLAFYVHRQDIPSTKWQINHNLGTYFFMRPIVWTLETQTIEPSPYDAVAGDTFTWNGLEYGVVEGANGRLWLDRNLGATRVATSPTDSEAYGDLYQWGRLTDGHEKRTSGTTSVLSSSDVPGHGDFIITSSDPYDWRIPQNNNLWQGVDGINNPCPPGWRLPTEAEWEAERLSWGTNNSAGAYNSPLKLPVGGNRYDYNGSLYYVGSRGHYWSSTVDGLFARNLYFYSSFASTVNYTRANGISVRPIKDVAPIDEVVTTVYPEEIDYDNLRITGLGTAELRFTSEVRGEAYFLSLTQEDEDVELPLYTHEQETPSDEWTIEHGLGTEDIIFSVVLREDGSVTSLSHPKYVEVGYDDFEIVDENTAKVYFSTPITGRISIATFDVDTYVEDIDSDEFSVEMSRHILKPLVLKMGKEIGYDYARMEDTLLKLGFTKPVIARIIVKRHD